MLRRRYRSCVPRTFLPPPGWPVPPAGWTPPVDWQPDPSWPPAPAGWVWWAEDETAVDRSADLQSVGAAAFAPVHQAPTYAPGFQPAPPTYAPGFQPAPPPPGFHGAPGMAPSGGFLPTGGPSAPAFGAGAPPSFLHIADQLRAEARRRALFGVLWLVGGLVVTAAFFVVAEPGGRFPIFWGAALYGLVQVIRGLVGYGRADKAALAQAAAIGAR